MKVKVEVMSENITTYDRYTRAGFFTGMITHLREIFGSVYQSPNVYGPAENEAFCQCIYKLIQIEFRNLNATGYIPWIQERLPDDDPTGEWLYDCSYMISYLNRQIMLKYKYFDYFKNKWSLTELGGLADKMVETLDRTIGKSGTVAKSTATTKAHDSTTDNTYTVDSEIVDSGSMSSKTADENSPLGTSLAADISTPSLKTSGTQTDSNTSTTDRTDTTHLVVDSDDTINETVQKSTTDTADDDYTKTKEFTNALEALKTLRYLDYSIVDVITDIVDSTCKEFTEII